MAQNIISFTNLINKDGPQINEMIQFFAILTLVLCCSMCLTVWVLAMRKKIKKNEDNYKPFLNDPFKDSPYKQVYDPPVYCESV